MIHIMDMFSLFNIWVCRVTFLLSSLSYQLEKSEHVWLQLWYAEVLRLTAWILCFLDVLLHQVLSSCQYPVVSVTCHTCLPTPVPAKHVSPPTTSALNQLSSHMSPDRKIDTYIQRQSLCPQNLYTVAVAHTHTCFRSNEINSSWTGKPVIFSPFNFVLGVSAWLHVKCIRFPLRRYSSDHSLSSSQTISYVPLDKPSSHMSQNRISIPELYYSFYVLYNVH